MQMATPEGDPWEASDDGCYVALTHRPLDIMSVINRVRSPQAGAMVLFAGTTRDNADGEPVATLFYSAYVPRALRTLASIAADAKNAHALRGIAIIHRLGNVPITEESILIAVSAPHRTEAWQAGAEALEACKARAEVWKHEEMAGDSHSPPVCHWRSNFGNGGGGGSNNGTITVTHGVHQHGPGSQFSVRAPGDATREVDTCSR